MVKVVKFSSCQCMTSIISTVSMCSSVLQAIISAIGAKIIFVGMLQVLDKEIGIYLSAQHTAVLLSKLEDI